MFPLVGIVSRLTRQKALMLLLKACIVSCKRRSNRSLGTGDPALNIPSHGLRKSILTSYQPISLLTSNLLKKSTQLVISSSCQVVLNHVACLK